MQERRTEVRMLCADMVEVSWRDRAGGGYSATGLLEDISPSGACLQLDGAVPVGTALRWNAAGHEFTGRVRYCVYREIGYFVGVEFESGTRWSQGTFEPQHLLDLEKLMR